MSLISDLKSKAEIVLQNAHQDVRAYVGALEGEAQGHKAFTIIVGVAGAIAGAVLGHLLW